MEFGLLIVPLSIGLFSAFSHCMGMCGPLSFALVAHSKTSALKSNSLFQLGRLTTYISLGLIGGSLGEVIHVRLNMGLSRVFVGALALFYLLFSLTYIFRGNAVGEKIWARLLPAVFKSGKMASNYGKSSYFMGLAAGALPCPSTYAVLIWSLSVPHVLLGVTGMIALWAVTLPAFAAAIAVDKIPGFKGKARQVVLASMFLGLAVWNGAGALGLFQPACMLHH